VAALLQFSLAKTTATTTDCKQSVPHNDLNSQSFMPRYSWLLLAAVTLLAAAQGCARTSITIEMQVLKSGRPLAKSLDAAERQAAEDVTVSAGQAEFYDLTRYQWSRLTSPKRTGPDVSPLLERKWVTEAGQRGSLRVEISPEETFEARMTVTTKDCCGLTLQDTTLTVHEAGRESSVTFRHQLSLLRPAVVELPPTHEGGAWTWVLLDVQKTPPAEKKPH
jgi:hypothetical protein